MRIGVFDPYLNTLGGGERYVLEIARCLSRNHAVYLFWNEPVIIEKAQDRFGLDFSMINFSTNIFSAKTSFLKRMLETKKYDLIIYVSDGSIPLSLAKKNILILQFPVNWVNGKSFLTRLKFTKINKVLCYSNFVKKFLDKTFPIESTVLSPSIDTEQIKIKPKENIIISVGRFTKALNTKKQDFLIDSFKKMYDNGLFGWKLILAGSVLPQDMDLIENLKEKIKNYPVLIYYNISFESIVDYYGRAKIYWHAAGYEENLENHPERAEHFGISTLEAMAAGAVPVVFNSGGQVEIIEDKKNGFLWNTQKELIEKTKYLIKNQKLLNKMSQDATKRASEFKNDIFCKKVNSLLTK